MKPTEDTRFWTVDGVDFDYPGKRAIAGLHASFGQGRLCGVVGPNGCGKTTLLHLLAGSLRPGAGRILLRGRSLGSFRRRELAREIALVPQDFWVNFPYTVREVVMMGRYPHLGRFSPPSGRDQALVEEALESTDTAALAGRLMTELSGGERQRVAAARALAQDTPSLLLDEATSHLDIRHALALLGLVRHRVKERGLTVIAVFHDLNLAARFCDDLILLQEGRLEAWGATAEALTPENLERVFGVEAQVRYEPFIAAHQVIFAGGGVQTQKSGSPAEPFGDDG